MTEDELLEVLRTRLSLNVKTSSEYTGGMDGPLYRDSHLIQLLLDGEVVSEASL